jgi:hypothetical protein
LFCPHIEHSKYWLAIAYDWTVCTAAVFVAFPVVLVIGFVPLVATAAVWLYTEDFRRGKIWGPLSETGLAFPALSGC